MTPRHLVLVIVWCIAGLACSVSARQLAVSGPFTASIDTAISRDMRLRVDAKTSDAFIGEIDDQLKRLMTGARTIIGAESRGQGPSRFYIHGYVDGVQVYWAEAENISGKNWRITTTFNAPDSIARLEHLNDSLSSFVTLYYRQGKQRETLGRKHDAFDAALEAKALALFDYALKDYATYLNGIDNTFTGMGKVEDVTRRFIAAISLLPEDRQAEIIAIRDAAIQSKGDAELAKALERLAAIKPSRWDETLLIEEQFADTHRNFKTWKLDAAHEKLTGAVPARITALLESAECIAQFDAELAAIPATTAALSYYAQIAEALDSQLARVPAFGPYADKQRCPESMLRLRIECS